MKTKIITILLLIFLTVFIWSVSIKEDEFHFYSSSTDGIIQKSLNLKGVWTNHDSDNTVDFEFIHSNGAKVIDVLIIPINSKECEVYIDGQFYRFLDYEINPKNFTRLEGQEMFVTYTTGHKVFWVFLIHNNDGVYSLTPWKSTSPI